MKQFLSLSSFAVAAFALSLSTVGCAVSSTDDGTDSRSQELRRGRDGGDDDSGQPGACPAGYELEVEHGSSTCKPHGGRAEDGKASGKDDGAAVGAAGGGAAGACTTDADCPAGLECEVEVEHGQTTSICKPHGKR